MYGTASKLGKMLMYIKWIVLAEENNFLLSRPVALYVLMHGPAVFQLLVHLQFMYLQYTDKQKHCDAHIYAYYTCT